MARSLVCKIIQKHVYDLLTYKYASFTALVVLVLLFLSILHFGEIVLEFNRKNYALNAFSDNIMGISYQSQLSQFLPIDVVYTWVNGSDPEFTKQLQGLNSVDKRMVCPVEKCVESHFVVVYPALAESVKLEQLRQLHIIFRNVTDIFSVQSHVDKTWVTILAFDSIESAAEVANSAHVILDGISYLTSHGLLTVDWTARDSVLLNDVVVVSAIENPISTDSFMEAVPVSLRQQISSVVWKHPPDGYAIVTLKTTSDTETFLSLDTNFAFLGSQTSILNANLILGLKPNDDASRSRFEDNEELRYSLRSLERFAPWVRHVYIVTNGQIPHWLDLDNPRVTIVTHEEIFPNVSHLPTFSSSAIECHLHRIPQLSHKFLYLNDDVFFSAKVWPDDFYTKARGQKVYLAWSVPDCKDGCPSIWIGDGYCDKSCNNSQCQWDGGDCQNEHHHDLSTVSSPNLKELFWQRIDRQYCNQQCANAWISDNYCDSACNTKECGFDAGDCGISNYFQLHEVVVEREVLDYALPAGVAVAYFNLSGLATIEGAVMEITFNDPDSVVRKAALNFKYRILTIIFYTVNVKSKIRVSVIQTLDDSDSKFCFNVTLGTFPVTNDTSIPHSNMSNLNFSLNDRANDSRSISPKYNNTDAIANGHETGFIRRKDIDIKINSPGKKKLFLKNYRKGPNRQSGSDIDARRQLLSYDANKNAKTLWMKSLKAERPSDTFGDSLRHVNRLLNEEFGFESRKVPAHMPHMFDINIMEMLQNRFKAEFIATSSNKMRSPNNMQIAFGYFYFLMSKKKEFTVNWLFKKFDTDQTGTLADREMRTLLANVFDLPLSYTTVQAVQDLIVNCSNIFPTNKYMPVPPYEHYLDSRMPLVTKELISNCKPVLEILVSKYSDEKMFRFELVAESSVTFKMLNTNLSQVIRDLDDIRKSPRKFICLNDNIDHNHRDAEMIKAVLTDFFESLLPHRSQFELPPAFRNRFLQVKELNEWRQNQKWLRNTIVVLILMLILVLFGSFIPIKIGKICRMCWRLLRGYAVGCPPRYTIIRV